MMIMDRSNIRTFLNRQNVLMNWKKTDRKLY